MPLLGPNGLPLGEAPPADAEPVEEALPAGPVECITAFVVYQLPNGLWQVADDLNVPLVPQRKPHGDDITGACAVTLRDAQTREVVTLAAQQLVPLMAQQVVQTQMQVAGAIREQATVQQAQQAIEKDQRRRGGR